MARRDRCVELDAIPPHQAIPGGDDVSNVGGGERTSAGALPLRPDTARDHHQLDDGVCSTTRPMGGGSATGVVTTDNDRDGWMYIGPKASSTAQHPVNAGRLLGRPTGGMI